MNYSFDYIIPINYFHESNETEIGKNIIKVIDCKNEADQNSLCGLWNFNHCPNDDDYCNPYIKGDALFFQYAYAGRTTKKIIATLYDQITGEPIDAIENLFTIQTGTVPATEKSYYNLIVDTNLIPDTIGCFYIKVGLYRCDLTEDSEYIECYNNEVALGTSSYLAEAKCYGLICANQTPIFSEPYCLTGCFDKTLLISGQYPKYDCDGSYYGPFGSTPNIYISQIRIYAELVHQNYTFEEVTVNNIRKSVSRKQNFLLQSKKLPPYVVERVAKAFGAQTVRIDGIIYKGAVSLTKNFEEGEMWILKEPVYQICDIIDFTCK